MDGQVSGLGTVHPLLTLSFVSTWILPLHVVSSTLKRKSSSSVMDGLQRRKKEKKISIVLSKYGVSELLIANVKQFYIGTSAVVATAHKDTQDFSTASGVLHGDSLAPFLFITLLDYILCETLLDNIDGFTITPRRSSRHPAVRIGALVYADDIAITCDTIEQAQNVF